MKIGIISDTHVPGAATALPQAVFHVFSGCDLILHAGDIVDPSVLQALQTVAPIEAVAGNMDSHQGLLHLPKKKVLTLGKFTVGLIHGKYRIDVQREMIRKEFGAVDLIVYGHSHMPFWGRVGDVIFLNPGSPTDNRHAPYHSVALLTVGDTLEAEIIRI
jgi:putative phosphoesterase